MKDFEVVIIQEETYSIQVKADTEEAATREALQLFENNKEEYHTDSDGTTSVSEL